MRHLSLSFGSVLVRVVSWRQLCLLQQEACPVGSLYTNFATGGHVPCGTWALEAVACLSMCMYVFSLFWCWWEGKMNVLNPREISACFPCLSGDAAPQLHSEN